MNCFLLNDSRSTSWHAVSNEIKNWFVRFVQENKSRSFEELQFLCYLFMFVYTYFLFIHVPFITVLHFRIRCPCFMYILKRRWTVFVWSAVTYVQVFFTLEGNNCRKGARAYIRTINKFCDSLCDSQLINLHGSTIAERARTYAP